MTEVESHRLSRDVLPIKYKVSLTPDFDNWTFKGSESIELDIKRQTKQIVLNSTTIDILEATFNEEQATIDYDKPLERATLSFPTAIGVGCGNLNLVFNGVLNDDMKGFYRSTYKDDSGNDVKMAVTQFEASDARRAFPCFDEPNMKATFELSLTVPKEKTALSNMPVKCQTEVEGGKLIKYDYEKTPKMSTYIVAFVIGELDCVEDQDSNGVKVRVYTPKGKAQRGKFALDVCCKTLPFYSEYFDIAYPLPKMDLVAIPDFAAGAMENWGLVTYRETMLLVDEAESSTMSRQVVALVVGHECAHMWFGNLVTMDWWTDLWLNEGFATWIEYLCVDFCYPEFDIWTEFASSEYARAIELDSLESSHPIQVTVHKPSEIDEIFDAISYSKGATIIRMLNDYLTNEKFKAGLSLYLKRHQYSNAVTADLWQALSEASGQPVASIMDTWTNQMGFPVIGVECVQDGAGHTIAVTLTQSRFLSGGGATDAAKSPQFWLVPVTVTSVDRPDVVLARLVMQPNGQPQTFPLPQPEPGFVKINSEAIGFYHTRYQEAVLPSLIGLVAENKLGPRDRLSLVVDQFALARAGEVPTTAALDIARGLKNETNFTVWSNLLSDVRLVTSIVSEMEPGLAPNMDRFYCELTGSIFKRLGWGSSTAGKLQESHSDKMLRPMILRVLGKCGHPAVVAEAVSRFQEHYKRVTSTSGGKTVIGGDFLSSQVSGSTKAVGGSSMLLPADLRGAVYMTVLRHGDENTLNQMLELLKLTDLHEERMRIMGTLGAVPYALMPRVHQFALSPEVRKQDKYRVLLSTVRDSTSRALFWDFMRSDWAVFRQHISNNHMLGVIVKNAFEDFVTEQRHDEVKEFFEKNQSDIKRSVDQTLENIKINVRHLHRDGDKLRQFFSQY